jgi:hypothetical protein
MICSLNILFNHPVSEATPNSKITGAYSSDCLTVQHAATPHTVNQKGIISNANCSHQKAITTRKITQNHGTNSAKS